MLTSAPCPHLVSPILVLFWVCLASASILYEGGTIIAFDESTRLISVLRNAHLLIDNDRITQTAEGPFNGNLSADSTRINATDKIITPGFIDTHHHLWETVFRTLGANAAIPEYFQKYGSPSPAMYYFNRDTTYYGQLMGCLELLYEGTTTVLDHAHGDFSDELADAAVNGTFNSGIRAYYAHTIQPTLANGYGWQAQIDKLNSLAGEARFTDPNTRVKLGLSYDGFDGAPSSNISTLWSIVQDRNLSIVTTHFTGGISGLYNSPELLNSMGWLDTSLPVIFAHGSEMSSRDASLLRTTNQFYSVTPESEDSYGIPWRDNQYVLDQAALGLDTHITFSGSLVQQARHWLQSVRNVMYEQLYERWELPRYSPMSVEQAFYLITRAGGLALRRDDLGVIKQGAKADIVVFRTDAPNMIGWSDPIAAVILHSDVGDIEDVLVDGEFIKRNGRIMRPDWSSISRSYKAAASRIQGTWAGIDWAAITDCGYSPCGNPLVIDTMRGNGTGY